MTRIQLSLKTVCIVALMMVSCAHAFAPSLQTTTQQQQQQHQVSTSSALFAGGYNARGRSSPRYGKERSKRQERVGHLVRSELGHIIHSGLIKGHDVGYLDDDLRKRISIINSDVAPDLRQARITVSIRKGHDEADAVVDRRRAYSWLVQNTKAIRHTLAQRMSHMKTVPDLTFVQADVSAAVDVMYLIDQVSAGTIKRESIGSYGGDDDSLPFGMVEGMDFDDIDGGEWIDEDDDLFMEEGIR